MKFLSHPFPRPEDYPGYEEYIKALEYYRQNEQ